MRKLFLVAVLFTITQAVAQVNSAANFGKQWVSGTGVAYLTNFQTNPPSCTFLDTTLYAPGFWHGHSNICDSAGNLLLCSNGMNLYNAVCDTIEDGDSLVDSAWYADALGFITLSQTSIIMPFQNQKYYLVNSYFSDSLFAGLPQDFMDRLAYHVVDMNANGGAGKVVRRKVQMVSYNTKLSRVQMMACRHANGRDWWLLKQGFDANVVYKFLFQQDTVLGPFIQRFPAPGFGGISYGGQSCFTLDGTRYATTCRGAGKVFVADFDRCSGVLSNPLVYNVPITSTHNPNDPAREPSDADKCRRGRDVPGF